MGELPSVALKKRRGRHPQATKTCAAFDPAACIVTCAAAMAAMIAGGPTVSASISPAVSPAATATISFARSMSRNVLNSLGSTPVCTQAGGREVALVLVGYFRWMGGPRGQGRGQGKRESHLVAARAAPESEKSKSGMKPSSS